MSFNLLSSAKELFTNELVAKASSYLGESENGVAKAIGGILPSVIGGLIDKTSTHEGATIVSKLAADQYQSGILNSTANFLGNENGSLLNKGAGLLSDLFGNKTDGLTTLISTYAGIKSPSSRSLLSMATPLVLGLIGKYIANKGSNASISSFLSSQKSSVDEALPSGLNLSSLFSGWNAAESKSVPKAAFQYKKEDKGSGSWLLPLLVVALVGLAAWFLLGKGCKGADSVSNGIDSLENKTEEVVADVKDGVSSIAGKIDSLTGDWFYDAGDTATIELPNNAGKLTVGKNSTEYKLINFLNDTNMVIDTVKGNWFEFTNVHFKNGGAELTEESLVQLKNMVAITKAYPSAQFKFGGYTDSTGTDAINIPLSQKRAEAVANTVVKLGSPKASIVGAEGYGQQWPIADNATVEGRAQNRRVAVNVKAK